MQITGNNSIANYVFDGGYSGNVSSGTLSFNGATILDPTLVGVLENPTGVTGTPVYYNTGTSIESGYQIGSYPQRIASGAGGTATSQSGYLYHRILKPLYGVCHGYGRDANVWYLGYNFYNAFHPEGYFAPPFGQNTTVWMKNQDGIEALAEDGSCANLTQSEYNDMFGIVSQTDSAVDASTDFLSDNSQSFINSPAIACPQDLSPTFYWHEQQYKIIAGTSAAIAGRTFYNDNPIPTALDNYASKTDKRYQSTGEETTGNYDFGNGIHAPIVTQHVLYTGGKPIPAYSSLGTNTINSMTCPGLIAEGSVIVGEQTESQLLDAPDNLGEPSKATFDFFNWWNIWHFLFKENSDGFPFDNGQNNYGDNIGLMRTPYGSHGSQLFEYELSDSDKYWERRQCPEAISYLPHTLGASIYACPSYHFDIPYYAATRKFGFYGARFFNGCVSLEMNYPLSGSDTHANAVDLPPNFTYSTPDGEEPQPDKGIAFSFSTYNNLLKIAKAEEQTSDFYALNKRLFLWGNSGIVQSSQEYADLSSNEKFVILFKNLFNDLDAAFPMGKSGLITGQPIFESGAASTIYATGSMYEMLTNNKTYRDFTSDLKGALSGANQQFFWSQIEKNYGMAFLSNSGAIDTSFYDALSSGREQRMRDRYMENFIKGNPIDLYPTNKIYFSYDQAKDVIESSGWGKGSFGYNLDDTGLARRYFLGAYANGEDVSGLNNWLANFTSLRDSSFYPGYFDAGIGLELPTPTYDTVITGTVNDAPLSQGWLAIGYNGVGELKDNFSCFTPIFVQQPMNKVFCKIGQAPTFRALAVDYHTIPEDKMNIRYPEIVYWMTKLKLSDSSYKNRYPISYKWYRIKKSDVSNSFSNFLLHPDFSKVSPSNPTGEWCALEGDGSVCTLIHPQECEPVFEGGNTWNSKYQNSPSYQLAKQNNYYMKFIKGAKKGNDDLYYYFCMARGRFGIRISEPSELFIDDFLNFDISIQNGGNVTAAPQVKFVAGDKELSCSPTSVPKYGGFVRDDDAIPEDVVQEQLPPPNRGYGDVFSYKFIGSWAYRGANQSYTPGTLNDTRGLVETWGRMLHYGSLAQYRVSLTQDDGDFLYGRNHLPICQNHAMPEGQDGIKVVVDGIVHWANMQTAIVDTDGRYGVQWNKLGNAGELYVPSVDVANAGQTTISPGIGQWQWGNNLGTIHSFGWNSPRSDLAVTPNNSSFSDDDFTKLKNMFVKDPVLAGDNCGWHKNGLGRNMLYWIEGFSSFYLYCDPIKKKNVTNYNYMNPGLRQTNSSMQYFWMGKPTNTYLERYPLFGPYAYHWKVRRHNRDRNGNGISEGFYSYGWGTNYTLQYDAPAIYGLFMKYGKSNRDLSTLKSARTAIFGTDTSSVKRTRFGFTNGDGSARTYGNVWMGDINGSSPTLDYVNSGVGFAQRPEFGLYGCSDADLAAGNCFDPCMSMRWQLGFLAGGKKQDMSTYYPDGAGYRIVPNSPVEDNTVLNETLLDGNGVYFRGAFGTPHLKYMKIQGAASGIHELNGFSPCFDGGADHCNYITPTLNLGSSMYQESQTSQFMANIGLAATSISLGGV